MFSTRPPGDPPPRAIDIWLSLLMIVLLWQCVVWISQAPSFILPGPVKVAQAIINNAALLAEHTLITAQEVILGLLLGTTLGTLTALLLMSSSAARRYLMPALLLSQTVPVFALAPLLTLWFGYGLFSKIVMTILIIYFPVTSTFYDGLANTPGGYLNLAKTMRATPRAILIKVRVPAALPSLASGIRLAAVYAPIGAVIGEWVGSSQGLGYLMLLANGRVKTDLMFAALIVLCLFTIVLRALVNRACRGIEARAGGRE
jgi:putative hydroxymethylpyrimidine transport system permease protein